MTGRRWRPGGAEPVPTRKRSSSAGHRCHGFIKLGRETARCPARLYDRTKICGECRARGSYVPEASRDHTP